MSNLNTNTWNSPTTFPVPIGRVVWILPEEGSVTLGEYWPHLGWSSWYAGEKFTEVLGWRFMEDCFCSPGHSPCQVCVEDWRVREWYENR